VADAFKHGFDIKNNSRDVRSLLDGLDFTKNFIEAYQKARRDGFSLLYMVLDDDSRGVQYDPMASSVTVRDVKKLEIHTIDNLARYDSSHGVVPAGADADPIENLDYDQYEIRPTGIVMDTDEMSDTYKEPLGYLIGEPNWIDNTNPATDVKFFHRNRFLHLTVNRTVDGDLTDPTLGKYEGDSVLVNVYDILNGLKKGNWSMMQTIFRYAAKLYHVELPEDADKEDYNNATQEMDNLNAKSEIVTPSGYEIQDYQTDGQLQPREYFDVLFDQICASVEMTKSVLFGTQSGTVTGSETDIKNYFNQVERLRNEEFEHLIHTFVEMVYQLTDNRTENEYTAEFDIEWGPLFKLSDMDKVERATRLMQTVSQGVDTFILTPMEAREVLQQEWADVDVDWTDDFTDEEVQFLQSLNVHQQGAETAQEKTEGEIKGGAPRQGQNGGGRERGTTNSTEDPTSQSDALSDRDVERIAQRLSEIQ
jgi:phage-related protein (TIGR01555 family)